jgi:GT2 family glycosyltransferase
MDQLRPERPAPNTYRVRELNGATASFPVDILHAVGGWNISLRAVEDLDLCARIMKKYPDLHFYRVPTAYVDHNPQMSLYRFIYRPYVRGLDTLRYYRLNRLTPPFFPFPMLWASAAALSGSINLLSGLLAAILLPQVLYLWWPARAIRKISLWYLLFAYLQLAEESATVAGLVRGQVLSRKLVS